MRLWFTVVLSDDDERSRVAGDCSADGAIPLRHRRRQFFHQCLSIWIAAGASTQRRARAAVEPDLSPPPTGTPLGIWLVIDPQGTVTLLSNSVEMGQGVTTVFPMLVAEELDVPLSAMRVRIAPPDERYLNPHFGRQLTGESASVRGMWEPLRIAGAQARARLVAAAAGRWATAAEALTTSDGFVVHPDGRRLAYGSLVVAAAELPEPSQVTLKPRGQWRLIGQPTPRLDARIKVDGSAVFGMDVRLPGMLHASIRMGPVLDSRVATIDATAARAAPGVVAVVFTGDGVAVVADTWWRAEQACKRLDIVWDEGPSAGIGTEDVRAKYRDALTTGQPILNDTPDGDVERALAEAASVHAVEYWSHHLHHATMEPMNFTAHWQDGRLRLIGPTQYPDSAQYAIVRELKLKAEQVGVETTFMGCGFGRRIENDVVLQAARIAMAVPGRPVQLLWSREQDMTHGFHRPIALNSIRVGLDRDGWPVAYDWIISSQSIKSRIWRNDPKKRDGTMFEYCRPPYAIAHRRFRALHTDAGVRVGFMRSVSHAFNVFANECLIDELAQMAGKDPLDYRLALLDPASTYVRVLNAVADKARWRDPPPAGRFRGLALMYGYDSVLAMVSEVSVEGGRVRVHRVTCAADIGTVVNPLNVPAQIESSVIFGLGACLMQEITVSGGRVQQRNFDSYPIPRMTDVPPIDSVLLASDRDPAGIAEPGTPLVQAATANAVSAALGRRIRQMPMTPERLARSG